jgi:hypothetical protein
MREDLKRAEKKIDKIVPALWKDQWRRLRALLRGRRQDHGARIDAPDVLHIDIWLQRMR